MNISLGYQRQNRQTWARVLWPNMNNYYF
jgi:hypothetical protein